uniref:WAP domain-containing protein n=1 Tax=Parastrongyloides trichosuri TaxID=131310 RepID=A0A0N4Z3V9_PARTI
MKFFLFILAIVAIINGKPVEEHVKIPFCPLGSRPMFRPDGEPRKCLPHQSNLCLNAIDDNTDPASVCCWHNQVDYFCCIDVSKEQCPSYRNVTVVIHNAFPQNPFPSKTFHFRDGIEDDFDVVENNLPLMRARERFN